MEQVHVKFAEHFYNALAEKPNALFSETVQEFCNKMNCPSGVIQQVKEDALYKQISNRSYALQSYPTVCDVMFMKKSKNLAIKMLSERPMFTKRELMNKIADMRMEKELLNL